MKSLCTYGKFDIEFVKFVQLELGYESRVIYVIFQVEWTRACQMEKINFGLNLFYDSTLDILHAYFRD